MIFERVREVCDVSRLEVHARNKVRIEQIIDLFERGKECVSAGDCSLAVQERCCVGNLDDIAIRVEALYANAWQPILRVVAEDSDCDE